VFSLPYFVVRVKDNLDGVRLFMGFNRAWAGLIAVASYKSIWSPLEYIVDLHPVLTAQIFTICSPVLMISKIETRWAYSNAHGRVKELRLLKSLPSMIYRKVRSYFEMIKDDSDLLVTLFCMEDIDAV